MANIDSAFAGTGRLPDFLILGAMKSGTTTLHSLLAQHPRIFMSEPKEPGFFSRDERFAKGLSSYTRLFSAAGEGQLCGESSTCYSRFPEYPHAAERIAQHLPDARFLFIMRHPIERMYSHYKHRMTENFQRKTGPVVPFEQAVREIPEIQGASMYAFQLGKFLERYPRERFLLLTMEDLTASPKETACRVHTFLGLPPISPERLERENEAGSKFAAETGDSQFHRLRQWRAAEMLATLLPDRVKVAMRKGIKRVLSVAVAGREQAAYDQLVGKLSREHRGRLLQEFAEPNRQLAELWGQPVPTSWYE